MRSDLDADVAVVGLGALGSAAAWQLARRGQRVIGLERFELGHSRGASHGDSRIIRLSYHTPGYVRNAREAYADWAGLEADSGTRLVLRCGGIDVFPEGAAIEAESYLTSLAAEAVPVDVLDAEESRRRWPGVAVPDGATVLRQAQTGIVPAGVGAATMQRQARAHGAELRAPAPVEALREVPDAVEVRLSGGEVLRAGRVVVTADAWTNQVFAGLGVSFPLTVTKEHAVHFAVDAARSADHAPGVFPVWIWMDDPSYYGFPSYGEPSVKVGQDCGGEPIDPDANDGAPDPEYVDRLRRFVRARIPGVGEVVRVTTCQYTLTPDRDFVVGFVPGHARVVVGLGAAHGFKFAPWFGRVLADLAVIGTTDSDIAAFHPEREALRDPAEPARWLV